MADFVYRIDGQKVERAIADSGPMRNLMESQVNRITGNANSMSAGFRTGIFHDHETGETRGNTQPRYGGDVRKFKNQLVGIVHPENYAAMKDNHKNNTLLKSI